MSDLSVTGISRHRPPAQPEYTPDEIVIMFKAGVDFDPSSLQTNSPQLNGLLRRLNVSGGEKLHKSNPKSNNSNAEKLGLNRIFKIKVPKGSNVRGIALELSSDPSVQFAEPNYKVKACATPDDPLYPDQWGLTKINAPTAWDTTTGNSAITVAILDTGVDRAHPDFAGSTWVNTGETPWNGIDDDGNGYTDDRFGWDFFNGNNNPSDDNGHGTYVAGITGAATNNTFGVAGLAWQVKLMSVKCLDSSGTADIAACVSAITYAVDNGADIINCSWGGYGFSLALRNAVKYAIAADRIVVGAAGNDGVDTPFYPAAYHGVIAVGSTYQNDSIASFSNYGYPIELVAPGVDIYSINAGGAFGMVTGTSTSAAFVSGLAVLIKANKSAYNSNQVFQKMATTAADFGIAGWDPLYGNGRIDAANAMQGNDPLRSYMTDPQEEDVVSGTININGSSDGPNFQNYEVEWGIGEIPASWSTTGVTLANGGTVAVTNGPIATFDATQVPAGSAFTIRLISRNSLGGVFYDYIRLNRQPAPIISGAVNDGTGADADYQTSLTTLSANWNGFTDVNPGIATITEYQYAIGTTPNGTDIIGWTSAGLSDNFTRTGLALVNGQKYYVTVRAINNKGESVDVCSDGITVDTTPPSGSVNDGSGADIASQLIGDFSANWSANDAESGIANFQVSIGTTPGGTQLKSWTDVGLATSFNFSGLSLVEGATYYTNIMARNGAGITSIISSNGVTIVPSLLAAPSYVNDGSGEDIDWQPGLTALSANWPAVPYASKYWYAIGSTAGGTDVLGWTDNSTGTSVTRNLALINGNKYYVSVRAQNMLGIFGDVRTSDGITVGVSTFKAKAYPNPFSLKRGTTIRIEMPSEGKVTIEIFDREGRLYKKLMNDEQRAAGIHEVQWDGRGRDGQKFTERVFFCMVTVKGGAGKENFKKLIKILVNQ